MKPQLETTARIARILRPVGDDRRADGDEADAPQRPEAERSAGDERERAAECEQECRERTRDAVVEDTLRGALSAMRLAVQEQSPDLVSVLRRFTVSRTDSSVSISGSVPAETFKTWVAKSQAHSSSR